MSKRLTRIVLVILALVPFAVGVAGYLAAGEPLNDALYGALALYYVNPVSDAHNAAIEFARWTGPLVLATAILCIISQYGTRFLFNMLGLRRNAVALYTPPEAAASRKSRDRTQGKKRLREIWAASCGNLIISTARRHVIALGTDQESLRFYHEHRAQLRGSEIYIAVSDLEYGLMTAASLQDDDERGGVMFFDVYGTVAHDLWLNRIRLWEQRAEEPKKAPVRILIIGEGRLTESVLEQGLLLNLLSMRQKVLYTVAGDHELFVRSHGGETEWTADSPAFPLGNCDKVSFVSAEGFWDTAPDADIIIVAEEVSPAKLQAIGAVNRHARIYYYAPENDSPIACTVLPMEPFGSQDILFNADEICRPEHVQAAKLLHHNNFAVDELTDPLQPSSDPDDSVLLREWRDLDNFTQWSNIASVDFQREMITILRAHDTELRYDRPSAEEIGEMEHIRWCRLHYLNYWSYDPEGSGRDEQKRTHPRLCQFKDLDGDSKSKNSRIGEHCIREAAGTEGLEREL